MKVIKFHRKAREIIQDFSKGMRRELGEALLKLQMEMALGLPLSRAMPSVAPGVHELRLRDEAGISRVFYMVKSEQGILVFHAFLKKTTKTPQSEIELARKRLKEMHHG